MPEINDITNKTLFMERPTKSKSKSPTLGARAKIPETIRQNKMVIFKSLLLSKVDNFREGQLEKHVRQWRKLSNDPNLLSIVFGDKIEFVDAR